MNDASARAPIGPHAYERWRASTLGTITDALESRLIFELIGELAGRRLLDVGCGDGSLVRQAAACGAVATGIDPDPAMIAAARLRAKEAGPGTQFLEGRAEQLPFPDGVFDVVCAVTSLCFVSDAAAAVREMARVLKPDGCLVIADLGRWSAWAAVRRVRGWLGAPVWKAARFRTAGDLRGLVEAAGLAVLAVRGAVYYPPVGRLAAAMAALDPWLGRLTTFGAAFIALRATTRIGRTARRLSPAVRCPGT